MELAHLPIIDWGQSTTLAGNKVDLAKELLNLLINSLSDELDAINKSHLKQNYTEMQRRVHKLHGALCYCGLPRLKTIVTHLETGLKSNIIYNLPPLLNQLSKEVNLLLEHYSHHFI